MDGPPAGHVGGLGRTVWGWAIDMAEASGMGVNQEVFAQPVTGGAETLLGTAAFEAVGRGRFAKPNATDRSLLLSGKRRDERSRA
jgi:hypothetical protein